MKNKKNVLKKIQVEKKRTDFIATLFLIIMGLFFLIVIGKVLYLQVTHKFHGEDLLEYREDRYSNIKYEHGRRGTIYDKYNNAIATDIVEYKIVFYLNQNRKTLNNEDDFVKDPIDTGTKVSEVLKLNDTDKEFVIKQLSQDPAKVYQTFIGRFGEGITLEQKEEIETLNLPGIDFEQKLKRYYPNGDFAPYLVGYTTSNDEQKVSGQLGVELYQDGYLQSEDGISYEQVDNSGVTIGNADYMEKHSNGIDVVTTIDPQVQTIVTKNMNNVLKDKSYDWAFTIVMDAKNGEVLSGHYLPSFDPNIMNIKDYENPFTEICFEPGSTIKSFTTAAAMEEGVWDPNKSGVTGKRSDPRWDDATIADWLYNIHDQNWGTISWEEGFYFSSNTIMTYIIDAIGYDKFVDYMKDTFKFSTPISNDQLKTSSCDYSPQYPFEVANTSFGQGMTVNAFQMMRGYTPFANKGDMYTPHIVKQLKDSVSGKSIYSSEDDKSLVTQDVISDETASEMLKLLRGGVDYERGDWRFQATGNPYNSNQVEIGGKSGTAQIVVDGSYSSNAYLQSFIGMAPINDPQIIVYTAVSNPKNDSVKSTHMGEYYTKIVEQTIGYLNSTKEIINQDELKKNETFILKDFTNMELNDAKNELLKSGVEVKMYGNGSVISQYPASSQAIANNSTVYLRGDGKFDSQQFINMNFEQANAICKMFEFNCKFNNLGKVVKYEVLDNTTYNLFLEPPKEITINNSTLRNRKDLMKIEDKIKE